MMKIGIAIPPPPTMDPFDFNDARPLPFLSAPSTPKGFGHFSLSAPTSPSRISEFYDYFDQYSLMNHTPTQQEKINGGDDFAFDFSAEMEEASLTADELFDGGKIRPLELPPRLKIHNSTRNDSGSSPRSPVQQGKKMMSGVFSQRKKMMSSNDLDPFAVAAEITRNRAENVRKSREVKRVSPSTRRSSRSVSPLRVSELCPWDEEEDDKPVKQSALVSKSSSPSNTSSATKSSSRKWRLKDFLLFRSASEGRAQDKDPFSKFRRHQEGKDSSFGSTDGSGSSRSKGAQVSAHELHYTVNKTVSQNLKKKTFLPYKQGILGRFAINPAAHILSGGGYGNPSR